MVMYTGVRPGVFGDIEGRMVMYRGVESCIEVYSDV